MTQRQLHFRVGLFVLVAGSIAGGMTFQFSDLAGLLRETYALGVRFDSAAGVHPSTPVTMQGLKVGEVSSVDLDLTRRGVRVGLRIETKYPVPKGTEATVTRDLLGGAEISLIPGESLDRLPPGSELVGRVPESPMETVARLEERVNESLTGFARTSDEWREVGANVNRLLTTNEESVQQVMRRSVASLDEFTTTMRQAGQTLGEARTAIETVNTFLADPEYQKHLTETLESLPVLVKQTSETIAAARATVKSVDANLANIKTITDPLAARSNLLAARLDRTLTNIESVSAHLKTVGDLMTKDDGAVVKLLSDPSAVRNLNDTTAALSVLMKNLQPIVKDIAVFSDKIARHPELLGVSGAMNGSSGLKTAPVQPANFERPRKW